jgi:hypothetical protein
MMEKAVSEPSSIGMGVDKKNPDPNGTRVA